VLVAIVYWGVYLRRRRTVPQPEAEMAAKAG
jgi:hypothetical protein